MVLDPQNISGSSGIMDSAKQAIDDLFEGQQETYEELMGKLGLFTHTNGNSTSQAAAENGYDIHREPKLNGHSSNGTHLNGNEMNTEMENGVSNADLVNDDIISEELEEGKLLPLSLERVLQGGGTLIPKIGNFVESDEESDLSSLSDFSDNEIEEQNRREKVENTEQDVDYNKMVETEKSSTELSERSIQQLQDVSEEISPARCENSNDSSDFNVLVLNRISDDDALPGQIFDAESEDVHAKITNLEISTQLLNKESEVHDKQSNEESPKKEFTDLIEEFKLDEDFDYDNVELTPKNWKMEFDTVCI